MIIIKGIFLISCITTLCLLYYGLLDAAKTILSNNHYNKNIKRKNTVEDKISIKDSDLFLLKNISNEQIDVLYNHKIYKIEHLKKTIASQENTLDFSRKLGVYKGLVDNWVRLGQFSTLHGMRREYIDLLEKVGIMNVKDLMKQDPNDLHIQLLSISGNAYAVPTIGMIKHWLRISQSIVN